MEKIYLFYMVMGFCLGSILFAYEIPRMVKHVDIRQISEDGNPGTFNAFAAAGVGWGILVLLAELLKGFFPVYLCSKRAGQDSLLFAGVLAAPVFGHAFSLFHKGKGGQGNCSQLRRAAWTSSMVDTCADPGWLLYFLFPCSSGEIPSEKKHYYLWLFRRGFPVSTVGIFCKNGNSAFVYGGGV